MTALGAISAAPFEKLLLAGRYACRRGLGPERLRASEGGGWLKRKRCRKGGLPHRMQRDGNGPARFNKRVRREPHCVGKGRQGLRRLVEGSGECNDPDEDEGAEAHTAVHRLWLERTTQ